MSQQQVEEAVPKAERKSFLKRLFSRRIWKKKVAKEASFSYLCENNEVENNTTSEKELQNKTALPKNATCSFPLSSIDEAVEFVTQVLKQPEVNDDYRILYQVVEICEKVILPRSGGS